MLYSSWKDIILASTNNYIFLPLYAVNFIYYGIGRVFIELKKKKSRGERVSHPELMGWNDSPRVR